MRLHRLLGILMLLDSRGVMKAGNLAQILETSERTIYRDIDILCEAGIPIMSISGPNGGYSFMENYKINSNVLQGGDVLTLLLSAMGITPDKNTEMAQQLKNAVIKLENSISEEHREEITKAKERFFIDSDPWWGKKAQNDNLDIIKNSVLNLKKLKIFYKKVSDDGSERIIRPYGAVIKNSEWYVIGSCETKKEIRVFKCNRIVTLEVLNESFSMPDNFNLEEFWEKSKDQFVKKTSLKTEPNSYLVKLKFHTNNNELLQGFFVHASNKVENYWIYEIDMLSFQTACNILFSLSDRIEVLEPEELREYIITKTKRIINIYGF